MRVAEQRSKRGGSPRGLFEWRAQTLPFAQLQIRATSSAAARVCEQRREPEGRRTWGRLSLLTFFGEAKKVSSRRATPGFHTLRRGGPKSHVRTSPHSGFRETQYPDKEV